MGTLVFQATLGGQVNLNGPNTASTFDIAVPATTGTMVTTGDSGTVTNTMLAASAYNTPGTIGSGTANTGAFTTLSASSTVSGTGFSNYLASPPAIGGTAPAAGKFTGITNTGLTSGRVVYSTTGGLETDSANLLYSGTDLTVYGLTVGRGGGAISSNTAVGSGAMAATATGINNSAFGYLALAVNTTGAGNTALGHATLYTNTTGGSNTALGIAALQNNTTASDNTAVGYTAGYNNTTGYGLVAVGKNALRANTTANNNVAIGADAAPANTTGTSLVAVGYHALFTNTTGSNNTAVGDSAIGLNTTGGNNTALGYAALLSNTTASNNTAVGYSSGSAITTGAKNTIIGSYTGSAAPISATGSNYVVLSDGDGNIVVSTKTAQTFALPGGTLSSGTGIAFPATQSASTDANTLDDYEEGTWTPTFNGQASGSVTLSAAIGAYTKIGQQVTVKGRIELSASTAAGGAIYIGGLPFTSINTAKSYSIGTMQADNLVYTGQLYSFMNPNNNVFYFFNGITGAAGTTLTGSAFSSTSTGTFFLTYFV
jgi:hypothetical protein